MDFLLRLSEPWAYVLVALLAAGEGAALIGLVLPGEASMLVAGVLVYEGRADLEPMLLAGCLGAVVGDSLGYWVGRRLARRLRSGFLGRRVGEERWERANDYLRTRGGRAIFIARFVGVLRALMPAIAGQAHFGYWRFLAYNAPGGILWTAGFITLGLAAGGSWHLVEQWAGRAALVLGAVALLALGVFLAARWVAGHFEQVTAARDRLLEARTMTRLRRRLRPQIDFLKRRLDARQRFGLYLTVGVALAVAGAWAFGAVLEEVLGGGELALFDRSVLRFLIRHREPYLDRAMIRITFLGSTPFVAGVLALGAIVAYARTKQSRWPAFLAATMVGGLALDDLAKALVGRPRPNLLPLVDAQGSSFPSGHATAAAALFGALAFVFTRGIRWHTAVQIWAAAVFCAVVVGLTRVYLGVHWPSDVLAGLALGGFWTATAATATAAWPRSQGGQGAVGWG